MRRLLGPSARAEMEAAGGCAFGFSCNSTEVEGRERIRVGDNRCVRSGWWLPNSEVSVGIFEAWRRLLRISGKPREGDDGERKSNAAEARQTPRYQQNQIDNLYSSNNQLGLRAYAPAGTGGTVLEGQNATAYVDREPR
jgi:hypothetical protein